MSIYIDRKFLYRITPKLHKFTQKKEDLYNFRCPICGDSQKNPNLKRGFVYKQKNNYFYKCHNCSVSLTFYAFLEKVDTELLKEYVVEKYKDNITPQKEPDVSEDIISVAKVKPKFSSKLNLKSINKLSKKHIARVYCDSRKIPEEKLNRLYYTDNFQLFTKSLNIDKVVPDDERLIIPFYNQKGDIIALQGRTLSNSKLRYITLKLTATEESEKFFGLDHINENEMIYVVEGPIDSLFINNSLATADSNLKRASTLYDKSMFTLVFDNEPRNKEIVKLMEQAIDDHYNIVIWPQMITKKDINEMILDGFTKDEMIDIIRQNTFVNLRAKMEFLMWKKI